MLHTYLRSQQKVLRTVRLVDNWYNQIENSTFIDRIHALHATRNRDKISCSENRFGELHGNFNMHCQIINNAYHTDMCKTSHCGLPSQPSHKGDQHYINYPVNLTVFSLNTHEYIKHSWIWINSFSDLSCCGAVAIRCRERKESDCWVITK